MQIVIEIDEKDYKDTLDGCFNITAFQNAIRYHSIPLPEHHGRLGDLDALEKFVIEKYSEGEQLAIDVSDVPTIIPATAKTLFDKMEEEFGKDWDIPKQTATKEGE